MADRYDELYRAFRWNVPARYNIAQACCGAWAAERSRFALYWEDESGARAAYSFWDIQQAANRLSNALAGLGVKRGDRVALLLPQRPETAIAYMAIFQMGAIALPLSHLFGPDALEYRLTHAERRERVRQAVGRLLHVPERPRRRGARLVLPVQGEAGAVLGPLAAAGARDVVALGHLPAERAVELLVAVHHGLIQFT